MAFGNAYDNLDDAAAAAMYMVARQPRVQGQEYMTLLVQGEDGKIRREAFQTSGDPDHSSWAGRPSGKIVGVVHNHPANKVGDKYAGTNFSLQDMDTARSLGVPSYVAAMEPSKTSSPKSQERKYRPDGPNAKAKTAVPGEQFLAQIPIDEMLEYMARSSPMTRAYLDRKKANAANPMVAASEKK